MAQFHESISTILYNTIKLQSTQSKFDDDKEICNDDWKDYKPEIIKHRQKLELDNPNDLTTCSL